MKHTNKGTSRREEEHNLYPYVCPTVYLTKMSTKHHKYVVNQKFDHVDDISFKEVLGRIRVVFFLQNKICPFLAQGICIYVGHSVL